MSTLMDGINNAYSLTAQINSLKSLDPSKIDDPNAVKYVLEKNFNQMLNDLVAATSDNDDEEDNGDYFSFLTSNNQSSLQSLQTQGILDADSIPDTNSPEYLNALYNLGQLY